jgi:hypothetical protein
MRAIVMRRRGRGRILGLAALAVAGALVWRAWPRHEAADPSLVDGRLWVDSRPDRRTDYVQAAFFVTDANLGIFERASSYDLRLEFFDMTRDTRTISLTFPQTNRHAKFTFSIRECTDHKPFDLCLTLSSNPWGGPTDYYGFSRPEDEQREMGALSRGVRAAARP